MRIVIDIEANALRNPDKIWCVVCKDIDSGKLHIFRNLTTDTEQCNAFLALSKNVELWIGHNLLGYDYHVLRLLIGLDIPNFAEKCIDTFVISRMADFERDKHSVESFGKEFGIDKINFSDFSKWSQDLEDYCIRDVEITHKIYLKYLKFISKKDNSKGIALENYFSLITYEMSTNGFSLNINKGTKLLQKVTNELLRLDDDILKVFPPKLKFIREITPKATKYGTISLSTIPKDLRDSIADFTVDAPFSYCHWVPFNPGSPKQIVSVLNAAGWKPTAKTKGHIETEREITRLGRARKATHALDITLQELYSKLDNQKKYGWKVNEENLSTLPSSAPAPAWTLAKRILYESRRKTLTEWLGLVQSDGRVHGEFQTIGAWTQRMASQKPNMQNIPNSTDLAGNVKILGKELRQLWQASGPDRLLVGVDAEGIQLRIFAHYIDDKEFTNAIVHGRKEDKSDPHNLNMRVLGSVCRSRAAAKRFIFALLLGAGIGKLAEILGCPNEDAEAALRRLMERYQGFTELKERVIPADAKRGWFRGIDGRAVAIPGESVGSRKHLCMSGYLQNGEAIVMKSATIKWHTELTNLGIDFKLVDMIHDEWQTETENNLETALLVANAQSRALREVGEELGLRCPLAGSFINDNGEYTFGTNWYQTH